MLIAVIVWVSEADNRAKERHYRAWELINSARGSSGDGGRKDALRDLNKDGVILAAAPLEGAFLLGVDLQGASLMRADLRGAYLEEANLRGAYLALASLRGANLEGVEGLTQEQLDSALGNDATQLPKHLTRPCCTDQLKLAVRTRSV